jgi:hypothetical protein
VVELVVLGECPVQVGPHDVQLRLVWLSAHSSSSITGRPRAFARRSCLIPFRAPGALWGVGNTSCGW